MSLDTVHTNRDFGTLTEEINEYLSSVKLSAEAFRYLTDYFRECERDVIICMVGDHAPAFISELPDDRLQPITDIELKKRIVPYIIWSNFDADFSFYTEYASMTDLIPMVLKAADIPLSPFYKTVLELHEAVPIRTSAGKYIDRNFAEGFYGDDGEHREILERYYFMAYNSLLDAKTYVNEWFCADK